MAKKVRQKPQFVPFISHAPADGPVLGRLDGFLSLTDQQRFDMLREWQEYAMACNGGHLPRRSNTQPVSGRIEVLELPESEIRRHRRSSRHPSRRTKGDV